MEPMRVCVLSVREKDGRYVALARADAQDATIHVRVWFHESPRATNRQRWQRARDEVLRFLDLE